MRIGIISLGEAGNLGDDLILIATANAIAAADPKYSVKYLGHRQTINWSEIASKMPLPHHLESHNIGSFPQRHYKANTPYLECDGVILGGGGLIQDSHNPARPFQWARMVPPSVPSLGIGLGVGPLRTSTRALLRAWGSPVDRLYVRDRESQAFCEGELGWHASIAGDLVSGDLIDKIIDPELSFERNEDSLGVSLRAWPGLGLEEVAAHLTRVGLHHGIGRATFFVLEARDGRGADVQFSEAVAKLLPFPADVIPYRPLALVEFVSQMRLCGRAVSMKLHASALWQHFGVPTHPIFYAPKSAALYGRPFRGLEIMQDEVVADNEWTESQRSDRVIRRWLDSLERGDHSVPNVRALNLGAKAARVVGGPLSVAGDLVTAAGGRARRARARLETTGWLQR